MIFFTYYYRNICAKLRVLSALYHLDNTGTRLSDLCDEPTTERTLLNYTLAEFRAGLLFLQLMELKFKCVNALKDWSSKEAKVALHRELSLPTFHDLKMNSWEIHQFKVIDESVEIIRKAESSKEVPFNEIFSATYNTPSMLEGTRRTFVVQSFSLEAKLDSIRATDPFCLTSVTALLNLLTDPD